jgi:hypothetical protein
MRGGPHDHGAAPRTHFGRCQARLEAAIDEACAGRASWPEKVAAAIRAALEHAAREPEGGRTLTEAAGRHPEDEEFEAMVERLASRLAAGAPPRNPRLPDAPTVVARIARQVNLELEAGREDHLAEVAPDLTFLALMPYLGFAEARRWSQPTATR